MMRAVTLQLQCIALDVITTTELSLMRYFYTISQLLQNKLHDRMFVNTSLLDFKNETLIKFFVCV